MKISKLLALIAIASGCSSIPMQAQIPVTDTAAIASNWTIMSHIWAQDISTGLKIAQTVQQGTQLINTGLNLYNLAKQETTALRNKHYMQAIGMLGALPAITGHPEWNRALSTASGIANASGVWQGMVLPGNSVMNRIQLADSFGTSIVNSLGNCQAAATQNDSAIRQLETIAMSLNALDNTHAALGGISGMSATQQLRTQQCQQNLQQQQLQAEMVRMMRERDYEQNQTTTLQKIVQAAAQNPRGITNLSALSTARFN